MYIKMYSGSLGAAAGFAPERSSLTGGGVPSVSNAGVVGTPRRGYWGNWGFFYSAPQDFVVLGVFCARFPPREASNSLENFFKKFGF